MNQTPLQPYISPAAKAMQEALRAKHNRNEKIRILFVCLGNICRSPAAEAVMIDTVNRLGISDKWEIDSAGTGNYHIGDLADPRMRQHAAKRGIRLLHRARQLSVSDFDDFDVIVAMDHSNLRNILSLSPTVETDSKVIPMSAFFPEGGFDGYDHVPDPYYSGAEGFELVLDMLQSACLTLAQTL